MADNHESAEKPDFEQELKRLESIVTKLEQGGLPLEENLKLFEEGQKVLKRCRTTLEQAQVRVEKLLSGGGREPIDPESLGR
ncbi:MAG: Exodeoxyribonuclease 7 small subunit [Calditrichaeota bacterium]|nr:Exodeoxyribonuclease 7 small subunit [Calditrichota bacterium]